MTTNVLQLYPHSGIEQTINGLYLNERLHELGSPGEPFVYGNFVTSLDGRIALADGADRDPYVPGSLTTNADWQLFQELQAQADCFITHGGYLRSLAAGTLDNILRVGHAGDSVHLLRWRRENGLPRQPAIVIASASLDFPLPEKQYIDDDQPVYIATGARADQEKILAWRRRGVEVIGAGRDHLVEGRPLIEKLGHLGFRSIYLVAGPLILQTMLRDRVLARLYLTISHQLLGGDSFHTMLTGAPLDETGRLQLRSLYFDALSDRRTGQFFACFNTADR
jgi:riboflavin biosynthesis pyrimidine reductase